MLDPLRSIFPRESEFCVGRFARADPLPPVPWRPDPGGLIWILHFLHLITMANAKFRGTLLNWMHHMHRMPNAPRAVIHALGDDGMHNCSQFVDHHPRAATCAALRACQVLYTGRRQRQAFRLACEGAHGTDCFV